VEKRRGEEGGEESKWREGGGEEGGQTGKAGERIEGNFARDLFRGREER